MKQSTSAFASLLSSICLSAILTLSLLSVLSGRSVDAHSEKMNSACLANATLYVDHSATGTNDGFSWTNAYTSLQNALQLAAVTPPCVGQIDIWVASGVYTPSVNITESFTLLDNVAIYGGFVGTETLLTERDWETNLTILSGDIDGDDLVDENGIVTDTGSIVLNNSYHVVVGSGTSASAVLDGFTITAGDALGSPSHRNGGGLYNNNGSPTLANLVFIGNYADLNGGGVYNNNSNPDLQNVQFIRNEAYDYGGGMYNDSSSPTLSDVTFTENLAWYDGGGLYNTDASLPILTNAVFKGNFADRDGGGVANHFDDSPPPRAFELEPSNQIAAATSPTFINVVFSGNLATFDGGGMYNSGTSNPPRGQEAQAPTGLAATSPILINVTFSGNEAARDGGGLYNNSESQPTIVNSIFWNNHDSSGDPLAVNITNQSTGPAISYSLVQGSGGSSSWDSNAGTDNGNNLDIDPSFVKAVDPLNSPTVDGDLGLQLGSPAINAGSNVSYTSPITTDLASNARINNTIIDMGAYEYQLVCPTSSNLFVNHTATGSDDGTSWDDAYSRLQDALLKATACSDVVDEIWVATGVYTPGNTITDSFMLIDDLAIYGGFAATETTRAERDWETNITVLSGDIDGDDTTDTYGVVLTTTDQVGDNSYHVVSGSSISNTAVLDGFYITAGQADGATPHNWGGGLYFSESNPTLNNLIISGNSASYGGGMANYSNSSPTLKDVTIRNNSSSFSGGGMVNLVDSSPSLTNVTVDGNSSGTHGGGIFNSGSSNSVLSKVVVSNNSADNNGGGIYMSGSAITVTQSLFENNRAGESGGGLYGIGAFSTYSISDTTISNNVAETVRGGGLYIRQGAAAHVINSTISGNQAPANGGLADDQGNGGGIYVGGPAPSFLTLEHTTVTNNEAAGNGGGIDINRDDVGDVLTITHSIVAGNIDNGGFPDCHAYGTSSYDLIVDSTNLFGGDAGDDCVPGASDLSLATLGLTITDVLASMADNGGVQAGSTVSSSIMQTHALVPNSPAIDASNSAQTADQRGVSRPQGAQNDIGAYEIEQFDLNLLFAGSGDGSVSGLSGSCTADCSETFVIGTVITLTASATSGSNFGGWAGACSGTGDCVVTIDEAKSVTVIFDLIGYYTLIVDMDGSGTGAVTKTPDSESYIEGTVVTLTATADIGSTFTGWSYGCPTRSSTCRTAIANSCSGTGDCVITMNYSQYLIATFEQNSYTLDIEYLGDGSGSITKSPDAPSYTHGTVVTLTAAADAGSIFSGWGDGCNTPAPRCDQISNSACSGIEECVITMTNSLTVSALFELETVTLNQPPDGGVVNTPTPEFDWDGEFEDPSDIVSYTVIVTSSTGVTYTFTTTDTTLIPSTGLPAGSYEWTVIGHRAGGGSVVASQTFSFTIAPTYVYFPFVSLETPPSCTAVTPLLENPIPRRPAESVGEIFYTNTVSIPVMREGCSFTLSSSSSEMIPILVDDVLRLSIGSEVIFEHDFSITGSLVEESILLPQAVVERMQGQSVTIMLVDRYDFLVRSTAIYLVSE